jgi:hypothetical protein
MGERRLGGCSARRGATQRVVPFASSATTRCAAQIPFAHVAIYEMSSNYAIRSERKTGEVVFDESMPCKCKHGDFFIISTYRSSELTTLVPKGVGRFVMY